jgi:hypothetical protein
MIIKIVIIIMIGHECKMRTLWWEEPVGGGEEKRECCGSANLIPIPYICA